MGGRVQRCVRPRLGRWRAGRSDLSIRGRMPVLGGNKLIMERSQPTGVCGIGTGQYLKFHLGRAQTVRRVVLDTGTGSTATGPGGSILSGGGSTPIDNTPVAWGDMVDRFQKAALATRLHIPLLYGIDAVHGDGNMYGATVSRTTSAWAPPATRPWSVRSGTSPRPRPGQRTSVVFLPVYLLPAGRPVGPHLRRLWRGPEPGHPDGDRD